MFVSRQGFFNFAFIFRGIPMAGSVAEKQSARQKLLAEISRLDYP
jgi:hypothetical protein